jgi:hypothetical protein
MLKKYKIRCRNCGIVVTTTPEKHDIVWKRDYRPDISPIDAEDEKKQTA